MPKSVEDKSYTNKNSNLTPVVSSRVKYEKDYFIGGPEKQTDMKVSVILTQFIHMS